jgi:hypothetical protein
MIRLTVIGDEGRAAVVATAPHFRITGGSVWIGPSVDGSMPLVRYVSGRWQYADVLWRGIRFEGKCRLLFGLPRDPAGVSDELGGLSIYDNILSASGIPFAIYEVERDTWRGVTVNAWWHAFRVQSAVQRPSLGPESSSENAQLPGALQDPRNLQ